MPWDAGTLTISSAGTPEAMSSDLESSALVRAETRIEDIIFHAPSGNTGNVFIGRIGRDNSTSTVASTYGITLKPGESFVVTGIGEQLQYIQGDAATTSDKIEWSVIF